MVPMKTYKLYLSRGLAAFYFFAMGMMTLGGVLLLIATLFRSNSSDLPPGWFVILWLSILGWVWYAFLRIPFEIRLLDNHSVEFRSLLRRAVVFPHEVGSIKAIPWSIGFVNVKYARGTIHLVNQIDGFHDLVATLKSLNPAIEIRGC